MMQLEAQLVITTVLTGLALTLGTSHSVSAPESDAEAITEDIMRCLPAKDLDSCVSLYTNDATYTTVLTSTATVARGKDGITNLYRGAFADNSSVEITAVQQSSDRASWTAKLCNDTLRRLGVDCAVSDIQAVLEGGKIKSLNNTRTPASQAIVEAARARAAAGQLPRSGDTRPPAGLAGAGALALLLGLAARTWRRIR